MIRLSDDYKRPWLGFTTKARGYDKWAHFAGSAAGVLLWVIGMRYISESPEWFIHTVGLWIGAVIVFGIGLGIEIYQGKKRWDYSHSDKVFPSSYDPSDGFSFVDLLADALGILLAVGVIV